MSRITITDEQITAAQAGDGDATWEIVVAFDPMFTDLIRTAAPGASATDAEDYLQEARAVLLQHIRDYHTDSSSASLSSYVYRAARRAVAEAHAMQSTPLSIDPTAALRVKYALWEHGSDVDAAWASFRDAEDPTKRMSRETFIAMVEALAEAGSLDAPVRAVEKGSAPQDGGDYGLSLADVIPDPSSEISGAVERRDLARWLMTQIPQRQAFALRAYYGVGMTKQTEQETCADMGVKPSNLRGLRSAGTKSARRVADVHGIAA